MKLIMTLILVVFVFQWIRSQELKSTKEFKTEFNLKGRLMFDYGNIDYENEFNESFTGSEIRRALLETSGKLSEHIGFKFQIDFARQILKFKEVNLFFDQLPIIGGRFSIGNVWVPYGLEQMTSNLHITFLERATTTSYLLQFGSGFLYENFNIWEDRLGVQFSYTANGTEFGSLNHKLREGQNLSMRLTINAIENRSKNELLHFGLNYTDKNPVRIKDESESIYLIAVRPESHLANPSLYYLFHEVNNVKIGGLEMAYTNGSFSIQGEYVNASVSTKNNTFQVPSYNGYISYFLTGEHRPRSSKNAFGRVKPKHHFNFKDRWGAVELAIRYSTFDLTSVEQGKLNNFTLGFNWYLNSFAKIMYNYIHSNNSSIEKINMHMMRFQIDFTKRIK